METYSIDETLGVLTLSLVVGRWSLLESFRDLDTIVSKPYHGSDLNGSDKLG